MDKLYRHKNALIILLVLLYALVAVIHLLLNRPQQAELRRLQRSAEDREIRREILERKLSGEDGGAASRYGDESIPPSEQTEDIVRKLAGVQTATGAAIEQIVFQDTAGDKAGASGKYGGEADKLPEGVKEIRFEIAVTGTYGEIRNFVKRIQEMPRLVAVYSIDLQLANNIGSGAAPVHAGAASPIELQSPLAPAAAGAEEETFAPVNEPATAASAVRMSACIGVAAYWAPAKS